MANNSAPAAPVYYDTPVRLFALVAVLWGRDAQSLAPLLGDVPRIASAHPSPMSADEMACRRELKSLDDVQPSYVDEIIHADLRPCMVVSEFIFHNTHELIMRPARPAPAARLTQDLFQDPLQDNHRVDQPTMPSHRSVSFSLFVLQARAVRPVSTGAGARPARRGSHR